MRLLTIGCPRAFATAAAISQVKVLGAGATLALLGLVMMHGAGERVG